MTFKCPYLLHPNTVIYWFWYFLFLYYYNFKIWYNDNENNIIFISLWLYTNNFDIDILYVLNTYN